MRDIGLDLYYLITIGDNEQRMAETLEQALERSDVIITTGGLGPTVDDVTRPAVARATHRELVLMPELLADIEAFFTHLGRQMTENNRRQAYIPAGATPIRNPVGTAPCFIVEDPRGIVISLPGVPREMEFLMQTEVLPYLSRKLGTQVIRARIIRTCAIGESTIDSLISDLEEMSNPTVGLAAHPGQTDVRITAKGQTEEEVHELIAQTEAQIRERLGDVIFGVDNETLEDVVARGLMEKDQSVAIVESHTHGFIAGQLRGAFGSASRGRPHPDDRGASPIHTPHRQRGPSRTGARSGAHEWGASGAFRSRDEQRGSRGTGRRFWRDPDGARNSHRTGQPHISLRRTAGAHAAMGHVSGARYAAARPARAASVILLGLVGKEFGGLPRK